MSKLNLMPGLSQGHGLKKDSIDASKSFTLQGFSLGEIKDA